MFEELFFYGGDGGRWLTDRMRRMQVTTVAAPFQAILDRAKICEFSVTELRQQLTSSKFISKISRSRYCVSAK